MEKEVDISVIKEPEFPRKEIGDIGPLKGSISQLGLLQPILVDENYRILAGWRRFLALKEKGVKKVPVRILKNLSPYAKFLVQWHENLYRKNLTWVEEIEFLKKEKELFEQAFPEAKKIRKYSLPHLAPLKPKDLKSFIKLKSEITGESITKLSRDLQLARALDLYPELRNLPSKTEAMRELEKKRGKAMTSSEKITSRKAIEQLRLICYCGNYSTGKEVKRDLHFSCFRRSFECKNCGIRVTAEIPY